VIRSIKVSTDPVYSDDKKDRSPTGEDYEEEVKTSQVLGTDGIIRNAIDTTDDISENAWTFRSVFLGIGLAIFGSVLAEIYYFNLKPFLSMVFFWS
jgi:hypothetical protein